MGQREVAKQVWDFLVSRGWTKQSVAGILGNIQSESSLNPDIWSGDGGYGLVQWTPGSKLIDWCNSLGMNYKTVDAQCQRIQFEMENGLQWFSNPQRPDLSYISFRDFTKLTDVKKQQNILLLFMNIPQIPTNQFEQHKRNIGTISLKMKGIQQVKEELKCKH